MFTDIYKEQYTEFINMAATYNILLLCKILLNYINKVDARKAILNEHKRIISRRYIFMNSVYIVGLYRVEPGSTRDNTLDGSDVSTTMATFSDI